MFEKPPKDESLITPEGQEGIGTEQEISDTTGFNKVPDEIKETAAHLSRTTEPNRMKEKDGRWIEVGGRATDGSGDEWLGVPAPSPEKEN